MRTWEEYKATMRAENPLLALARNGNVEALAQALTPENIDEKNHKGYSALMLAAYNGQYEACEYLLIHGADPNSADATGSTILMGAAFKGNLEIVKLLVDHGADVDMENPKGQTALQFAQMFGRSEVVKYLKNRKDKAEVFGLVDIVSGWSSFMFKGGRA
jgi:FOG: Ankyrin repeat